MLCVRCVVVPFLKFLKFLLRGLGLRSHAKPAEVSVRLGSPKPTEASVRTRSQVKPAEVSLRLWSHAKPAEVSVRLTSCAKPAEVSVGLKHTCSVCGVSSFPFLSFSSFYCVA